MKVLQQCMWKGWANASGQAPSHPRKVNIFIYTILILKLRDKNISKKKIYIHIYQRILLEKQNLQQCNFGLLRNGNRQPYYVRSRNRVVPFQKRLWALRLKQWQSVHSSVSSASKHQMSLKVQVIMILKKEWLEVSCEPNIPRSSWASQCFLLQSLSIFCLKRNIQYGPSSGKLCGSSLMHRVHQTLMLTHARFLEIGTLILMGGHGWQQWKHTSPALHTATCGQMTKP